MSKSKSKGRYICKVGFYDIYAKDTMKPGKESKKVASTDYQLYHGKKLKEKGFKTKDLAVVRGNELMSQHKVSD